MNSKIFASLLIIPAIFAMGCVQNTNTGEQNGIGLANPASVWCEEQNGTLTIRDTAGGQVGYCTLNNRTCEEWALYRSSGAVCEE